MNAEAPSVRTPNSQSLWRVAVLAALVVGIEQTYYYAVRYTGVLGSWVAFFLVPVGIVLLLWWWIASERRSPREFGWVIYENPFKVVGLALAFFGLYLLVTLEPGIFVGLGRQPVPTAAVSAGLIAGILASSAAQQGVFQGYLLRRWTETRSFAWGLMIAAAGSAVASTNFWGLTALSAQDFGTYLFTTTATAFALAVVLGVYLYKSRWSLLGPVVFGTGVLLTPYLIPVFLAGGGWLLEFIVEILAYSLILIVLATVVREPGYLSRRYLGEEFGPKRFRFQERAEARREARRTGVALACLAVVVVVSIFAAQAYTGERTPTLAIATGSMVPTLVRGDLVVIEHASTGQIAVGTIIAFSVSCLPSPTVHRVISVENASTGSPVYRTKGDANAAADPCPVPYADVLGRVVATVPLLGYFELQPALPIGLVLLAVLIAILVEPNSGRRRRSRAP